MHFALFYFPMHLSEPGVHYSVEGNQTIEGLSDYIFGTSQQFVYAQTNVEVFPKNKYLHEIHNKYNNKN